jgi:hypothetical protein
MREVLFVAALVVIISELGGIWREIHQMRSEQVKNATYALPQNRRDAIRKTALGKKLESTALVDGHVTVEGKVEIEQPIEVNIDN